MASLKKTILRAGLAVMACWTSVALVPGQAARATTITFDALPTGGFQGPFTENGFTYKSNTPLPPSLISVIDAASQGNPGQNLQGGHFPGTAVLSIVSTTSGLFTFSGLDYAALSISAGSTLSPNQTLNVSGLLGGSVVGSASYTLSNSFLASLPTGA